MSAIVPIRRTRTPARSWLPLCLLPLAAATGLAACDRSVVSPEPYAGLPSALPGRRARRDRDLVDPERAQRLGDGMDQPGGRGVPPRHGLRVPEHGSHRRTSPGGGAAGDRDDRRALLGSVPGDLRPRDAQPAGLRAGRAERRARGAGHRPQGPRDRGGYPDDALHPSRDGRPGRDETPGTGGRTGVHRDVARAPERAGQVGSP